MYLTEETIKKVDNLVSKTIDLPAEVVTATGEVGEDIIKKTPLLKKLEPTIETIKRNLMADPTKLPREQNMKDWMVGMSAGSLALALPGLYSGEMDPLTAGAVVGGNALKGAAIGAALTGGKDTLLKSALIPAGTTAIMTPLINDAGEYLGVHDADAMPEARVGAAAALGSGLWALRNKGKNKKWY